MGRSAVKLLIIALLVAAGVSFWYERLEKKIMPAVEDSVQPVTEPGAAKKNEDSNDLKEQTPQSVDYQVIVKRNIFQAVLEAVAPPPKKEVKKVVATSLDLTLLGTVAGDEQTARAIIIDNKAKKQDIFQIGDAIQGAFIETIDRGKITLDVDGRNEVLLIKERQGGGPGAPELPQDMSLPQDVVEKSKRSVRRRSPRLRRNRRISRRQDPEKANIEPEVFPEENFEEIDEPEPAVISPDEEVLPPPV